MTSNFSSLHSLWVIILIAYADHNYQRFHCIIFNHVLGEECKLRSPLLFSFLYTLATSSLLGQNNFLSTFSTHKLFGSLGYECEDGGPVGYKLVLCTLVEVDQRFRISYCLYRQGSEAHLPDDGAVSNSETSVYFSEIIRRCIPDSCHVLELIIFTSGDHDVSFLQYNLKY